MDLELNNLQRLICHKTQETKPNQTIVQARYRKKFNICTFPNRCQIFQLIKDFAAYNTHQNRTATNSLPSGPLITIQTLKNVTRIHELVNQSPSRFERWTSGEHTLESAPFFRPCATSKQKA